jgi:hypothetical protein
MTRALILFALVLSSFEVSAQQPQSAAAPAVPAEIEQWMRSAWGVDPKSMGYTDTHFLLSLTESERQGAFLFKQRCNACHYSTVAAISGARTGLQTSASYGPSLSKKNVEGREDEVRRQIAEGSPRMPAFKYGLQEAQINMIVSYLKKVESDTTVNYLKRRQGQ